jgi:hypothetical protein
MDRKEHHRTRMLVQYSDDLTDGTCSIHCLALSLGVNIDREPKNIWVRTTARLLNHVRWCRSIT